MSEAVAPMTICDMGGGFYWCPSLKVIVRGKTQEEAQLRADLMALRKTLKEA